MLIERIWAQNEGRNYHYLIACTETRRGARSSIRSTRRRVWRARASWAVRITPDIQHPRASRPHRRQRRNRGGHRRPGAGARSSGRSHRRRHARHARRRRGACRTHRRAALSRYARPHARASVSLRGRSRQRSRRRCSRAIRCSTPARAIACTAAIRSCSTRPSPKNSARLPDSARIFPGHDYLLRNLAFTLDREPSNSAAKEMARLLRRPDRHAHADL